MTPLARSCRLREVLAYVVAYEWRRTSEIAACLNDPSFTRAQILSALWLLQRVPSQIAFERRGTGLWWRRVAGSRGDVE